jgi:hypothetical protein
MRRAVLLALALVACGGSDDNPAEATGAATAAIARPAEFHLRTGHVLCVRADYAYHSAFVGVCEWDCGSHGGQAGFVHASFAYPPVTNNPEVDLWAEPEVAVYVTPREGCQ